MKQVGLPLEDLPEPEHVAPARVTQNYQVAANKLNNVRVLIPRDQRPSNVEDQRRFNIPPNGNPVLFDRAS